MNIPDKFIHFNTDDCYYCYKANQINSVQSEFNSNTFYIQFDTGVVQNYEFKRASDCRTIYKWVVDQLCGRGKND